MSYFGFLGHFEKDRVFISWLNDKPYATGYTGLEPWHPEPTGTEQLSWCGEWVERLMAVNLTPSCTLRLSVDALERASLEPKIPRNQKMPPEREQTSKAGGSGYLSFHLELEHIFVSYGCHCGGQPRVAIPNHNPWLGSKVVPKALPGPMSVMLCLMN